MARYPDPVFLYQIIRNVALKSASSVNIIFIQFFCHSILCRINFFIYNFKDGALQPPKEGWIHPLYIPAHLDPPQQTEKVLYSVMVPSGADANGMVLPPISSLANIISADNENSNLCLPRNEDLDDIDMKLPETTISRAKETTISPAKTTTPMVVVHDLLCPEKEKSPVKEESVEPVEPVEPQPNQEFEVTIFLNIYRVSCFLYYH